MTESTTDHTSQRAETAVAWVLRLGAVLTLSAFFTALLPEATIRGVHERLGFGPLQLSPVVEYMARSLSLLYGFHGGLLLLASTNVRRYRPIVRYFGWMNLIFGVAILLIDLEAGLPSWWSWFEGPPVVGFGVIILLLARRVRPLAG